ncbi:MAG TPA: SDR family oxidoreductase [Gammaproteobacteria bacterium]|nr:SDR family oxidoreductase [Gammaproteobacteria bacterium]
MSIHTCEQELVANPRTWLITGVAGFIGSNLLERLLRLGQKVTGLDNLSTGHLQNLETVRALVTPAQWARFHFIAGDICDLTTCATAVQGVGCVLHQAALGSVPRSLLEPIATHETNVNGFLNMLIAARDAHVSRFIYASSSSVYGDDPGLPKVEDQIGKLLSPYAATKYINEAYADLFSRCYGMQTVGLRYFNVFGARQDPEGAYAAVIPQWFKALIQKQPVYINGDGETSRDFCFVDNAVQANLLSAMTQDEAALNKTYNVAVGERISLKQLYDLISAEVVRLLSIARSSPVYRDFRPGDVRHSLADISRARRLLGYEPTMRVGKGLQEAAGYYMQIFKDRH